MNISPTFDVLSLKLEVNANNFKNFFMKLYNKETDGLTKEEALKTIQSFKQEFEAMIEEANALKVTPEQKPLLGNLSYSIVSHILFANDLYTFYCEDLFDRFRLRIDNYVQRERVNTLLFPQ